MSGLAAIPGWVGPALGIAGTLLNLEGGQQVSQSQVNTLSQQATNERLAAEFEAQQLEYQAGQTLASSQKAAIEQRKASALLASRALAAAGASGAGASDPTVIDIISNIDGEGAYRAALALYEGEEQARSMTVAATARRLGGSSAAAARMSEASSVSTAGKYSSFSTLLGGGSSFLGKYGSSLGGSEDAFNATLTYV